jgi:ribosomal protein S18 acetylase RimI-like enzyme
MIDNSPRFVVRPYRPEDAPQLRRLYARVGNPYRLEDEAELAGMRTRAQRAQQAGERWSPTTPPERTVEEAAHLSFWVAAVVPDEVVGTVGLRKVGDANTIGSDTAENSSMPLVRSWIESGNVGEVRRLRVAPEWRRCGFATALMQELVNSSIYSFGLRSLVLNTTAAQLPALALYLKLGFNELGRSYLGSYELVWMQRLVWVDDVGQS